METITVKDLTKVSAMDVYELKQKLDMLEDEDEKDILAANCGFAYESVGARGAANRAYRAYNCIESDINKCGDVAAVIYATGEDQKLCRRAVSATRRNRIDSIEKLEEFVSKGKDWNLYYGKQVGQVVFKIWENAIKIAKKEA